MIKVHDIAYVRFAAPELDEMQRFGADFGLALAAIENDTLYHRGTDPSPYIHVTELGEAGFRGVAFEASSAGDLTAASRLEGASPVEKLDGPGGGQVVRFTDPDGYAVEVVHGREQVPALPVPTSTGLNRGSRWCDGIDTRSAATCCYDDYQHCNSKNRRKIFHSVHFAFLMNHYQLCRSYSLLTSRWREIKIDLERGAHPLVISKDVKASNMLQMTLHHIQSFSWRGR